MWPTTCPEPPDTLAPGLAGTLFDDSADMQDIVATIVDLARRKAISITEEKEEGFWRSGTDFIYRRENKDVPLAPFEQEVLDGLFGMGDEVRLSDLKNKFYQHISGIKKKMYADLVQRGYYRESPERVRTQFGCAGGALLVFGVVLGVLLTIFLIDYTVAAICPGIGLFVTAMALVIIARYMPREDRRRRRSCCSVASIPRIPEEHRQVHRRGGAEGDLGSLAALCDCLWLRQGLHSQV